MNIIWIPIMQNFVGLWTFQINFFILQIAGLKFQQSAAAPDWKGVGRIPLS